MEVAELYQIDIRKARKVHKCADCLGVIPVGESRAPIASRCAMTSTPGNPLMSAFVSANWWTPFLI